MHNVDRLGTTVVRKYIIKFTELHTEGLRKNCTLAYSVSMDTVLKFKAEVLRR
jgi:hypothetical protein